MKTIMRKYWVNKAIHVDEERWIDFKKEIFELKEKVPMKHVLDEILKDWIKKAKKQRLHEQENAPLSKQA